MAKLIKFLLIVLALSLTLNFYGFVFVEAQRLPGPIDEPKPEEDSDRDGIPDSVDKCPREPETYNGFEDEDGCPDTVPIQDEDKDGIEDSLDKCPKEPENFNGFEDTDGCPDDPRGPTEVFVFAERKGNAILVTWKTPIDTVEEIKYMYEVLKSTNGSPFETIVFSERDIDEKVKTETKEESFFHLDTKVKGGNSYSYQVATKNPNDGTQIISEPSNVITLSDNTRQSITIAKAHLIEGRNLTAIPVPEKDSKITKTSWTSFFNIFKLANAETFVDDIFTTSQNPQEELYRLALEPIPSPNGTNNCDQKLHFRYEKDADNGQQFNVITSIFEIETVRDDIGPNGTEVETEVETLRHQKNITIHEFAPGNTVKQKWFVINPANQTIINFTNLEIQFDITAENKTQEFHREVTFWDVFLQVPTNHNC